MAVGQPRVGLRPANGLYPGAADDGGIDDPPAIDASAPADDLYPSETLYPYVRFIKMPSTSSEPGDDLIISTLNVTVERFLQIAGFGRPEFLMSNKIRSAILHVLSTSLVGFPYVVPSEAARKMGVKVPLATASTKVKLSSGAARVELATANRRVSL